MIIAIDFDGTVVKHRYPQIGEEIPFATDTLRLLIEDQHKLILWTVREGKLLDEAVEWCRERGVEFYAINRDYPEEKGGESGFSRKVKADLFIDDRNLGGLPDWSVIYKMVKYRRHLKPYIDKEDDFEKPRKLTLKERIAGVTDPTRRRL